MRKRNVAVCVVAIAGSSARATIAFRNDPGQPCAFCHATPGTDAFAAQWRVNGAPTAYVKNAC